MLYEELLDFSKERIKEFFKNTKLFEGQFEFNDFHKLCYANMYENNFSDNIEKVKDLKTKIPELVNTCKKCGSFYMNPRNKSLLVYDVMMGQFFENLLIDFLNEKLHIKAMHANTKNKKYPDCMILSGDKQILAYFEVKYHSAPFITAISKINRYCYEGSTTLDYKKIIKQLEIIESDLDRPVFYLHWIDFPCLKGVFFETSEQVKENLYKGESFERKKKEGDLQKNPQSVYLGKIYSPLLEMGTFEEFINTVKSLNKRG